MGEEAVSAEPEIRNAVSSGIVWCVDPVDGTRNFVQQKSAFCAMTSLVIDNSPLASWIYVPLRDICYFTASGKGCWKTEAGGWHKLAKHSTVRQQPDLIGTATIRGLSGEKREAVGRRLKLYLADNLLDVLALGHSNDYRCT